MFTRKLTPYARRRHQPLEQTEPFDHHTTKRQIDFTVGVAVGVMIVACSSIYVLGVMFDY